MASISVRDKYFSLFKGLFPRGFAWLFTPSNPLTLLLNSLSWEFARVEERAFKFLDEQDPNMTFEMLERWETVLGIPDECTPTDVTPSIFDRRVRVLQKLTTGGGQSPAFYKLIAKQLGYDADVIDVKNFKDFRVGTARIGDALTNSTIPGGGGISSAGWAYTFMIKAPADLIRPFRVGQSTVGERLVRTENATLECVIRKFAPAHVIVLFSYGE